MGGGAKVVAVGKLTLGDNVEACEAPSEVSAGRCW